LGKVSGGRGGGGDSLGGRGGGGRGGGIIRPGEGGGFEKSQEEWSGWGWWEEEIGRPGETGGLRGRGGPVQR